MLDCGRLAVVGSCSNSVTRVSATQSPRFARMASGSAGLSPASTASLSSFRTKILPVESVPWPLIWIGSWMEVRLNLRIGAFCGQSPSSRPAQGLGLSVRRRGHRRVAEERRAGVPVRGQRRALADVRAQQRVGDAAVLPG